MIDPLAEVVTLLQPIAPAGKLVSARGAWRVLRAHWGRPYDARSSTGAAGSPPTAIGRSSSKRATPCTALARSVGMPPTRYARQPAEAPSARRADG